MKFRKHSHSENQEALILELDSLKFHSKGPPLVELIR